MAAIAEELVFREKPRSTGEDDAPEVSIVEGPAGRETLAAIEVALRPPRARMATLGYGDRISNAPGAKTPSRAPAPSPATLPQPATSPQPPTPVAAVSAPPTIFEMLTFVVQGAEAASLAADSQRRRFVEAHLLQRIPNQDMAHVDRVDVTPWTVKDTLVVRVWCRV